MDVVGQRKLAGHSSPLFADDCGMTTSGSLGRALESRRARFGTRVSRRWRRVRCTATETVPNQGAAIVSGLMDAGRIATWACAPTSRIPTPGSSTPGMGFSLVAAALAPWVISKVVGSGMLDSWDAGVVRAWWSHDGLGVE